MARLYRALESISQYHLATFYGLDASAPDWSKLKPEQQQAVRRCIPDRSVGGGLPSKISLDDGWKILWALDHDVAKGVVSGSAEDGLPKLCGEFQSILQKRNSSILAHGWDPVSGRDVEKLMRQLKRLIEKCNSQEACEAFDALTVPEMPSLYRFRM